MDMRDFALGLLNRSPQVANNPQAQQMIDVIRRGDSKQGQMIAQNLCNTYGVTPEQGLQQAQQFFGIR